MQFLLKQKLPNLLPDTFGASDPVSHPVAVTLHPDGKDHRFQRLLSAAAWAELPSRVQQRFVKRLAPGTSIVFRGQIIAMQMSPLGWVLAQAARLVGAPLPVDPYGAKKAAIVSVSDDELTGGQIWTRIYCKKNGFPQAVNSVKCFDGPTGLEEHVGAGIGMALTLRVEAGSLLFETDHYFLKTPFGRVKLPAFLCPGRMVVGHHDLAAAGAPGRFSFTLDLVHPVFGTLVHQNVLFTDMEENRHD